MSTKNETQDVKVSKKIGKVVVFYDDNSFEEVGE